MKWVVGAAWLALVLVRIPSLVQPAGGDQGLYAYVGQQIVKGDLPYRDAWDQKPPAIHYTYALMYSLWPHESVIASVDLTAAVGVAWLLVLLGRRFSGRAGAGEAAALIYLLLSNPAFTRLGGVRTRAQCETFIALAVTGAVALMVRATDRVAAISAPLLGAGMLLGLAAVYKYNAVTYSAAFVLLLALLDPSHRGFLRNARDLAVGFVVPVVVMALVFVGGGAWDDLIQATVYYNLRYSGETYSGPGGFLRYLITFPIQSARIDALWFLGGLGAVWLVVRFLRARSASGALLIVTPVWIAAAILSIAINSSRGLPQYFIQAQPALALAAGLALADWWRERRAIGRTVMAACLILAVIRINAFDNAWIRTAADVGYLTGRMDREEYLKRFGGQRADDKFSALAVENLGTYLRVHTHVNDPVFVFGFAGAAYVQADRRSASRFFWSRPIIIGFNDGRPGYGTEGLLAELNARPPQVVVLQHRDWDPDTVDSATFFMRTPRLADWLRHGYRPTESWHNFDIWTRNPTAG